MPNSFVSILRRPIESLRSFQGNARTCVIVEPMWAIPYNLFVPYASLYMLSLGVNERGIGLIASVGMVLQTIWSLTAGAITDRLGRRRTSLIFDLISWSIPTALWALARDFWWFLIAAALNSAVRVVHISWSCLFIEDSKPSNRVKLYTWIQVAGTLSGFFAPLAGLLVASLGLVPATRALYAFSFVMMTSMFFIRNAFCSETAMGKAKMAESRSFSFRRSFEEYRAGALSLFGKREAVLAFMLGILSNIHLQTRASFLSVVLTKGIGLKPSLIAVFPFLASATTLVVYLLVIPRLRRIKRPLILSLGVNTLGNILLWLAPSGGPDGSAAAIAIVALGTLAVAAGIGVTGPVIEAVLANAVEDSKRASIMSIVYTLMYGVSAPFAWVAGLLAEAGGRLPALLAAATMAVSLVLALGLKRGGEAANEA